MSPRALDTLSDATRPLRPFGFAALGLGLTLFAIGAVRYVLAPSERPFGADGWFESASARMDAESGAMTFLMFGAFIAIVGVALLVSSSRRVMQAKLGALSATAAAVREGLVGDTGRPALDPSARLTRLEDLHRRGHLTTAEYQRKRTEIVDSL